MARWALLELMRDAAVRHSSGNVEFVRNTAGLRLVVDDVARPSKVLGVATSNEEVLHAATVINCAGAYSAELTYPGVAQLPVAPRRRCIFALSSPEDAACDFPRPPGDAPLTIDTTGAYFRGDLRAGRYICGMSPPEHRGDPDVAADDDLEDVDHDLFEDAIWPAIASRAPALEQCRVETAWSGLYEYNTLDQNGVVGPHPDLPNLFLGTGFSGHGLQHAPGVGRALAELLCDGSFQTIDLSPLSFDRITAETPCFETGIY